MTEFYKNIGEIAVYLYPAIAIIYSISLKNKNKAYRIFTLYLITMALVQLGAFYVGRGGLGKPNLYFSHFYHISQFFLLSIFYFQLLQKKIVKIFMIPVALFLIFQFVYDPGIFLVYNPLGMTITQTILVIYAILYLYKTLQGKSEFIITNIGLLVYLLSSTLIFASGNLVLNLEIPEKTKFLLINVNRILVVVFQVLLLIEWWQNYSNFKPLKEKN